MAPLLNRVAIKAEYRSANARQVQAVFDFERAILRAFTEVYHQLNAISNLRRRYEQVAQQVAALRYGDRGVEGALSIGTPTALRQASGTSWWSRRSAGAVVDLGDVVGVGDDFEDAHPGDGCGLVALPDLRCSRRRARLQPSMCRFHRQGDARGGGARSPVAPETRM